jgi:hypothetical protein
MKIVSLLVGSTLLSLFLINGVRADSAADASRPLLTADGDRSDHVAMLNVGQTTDAQKSVAASPAGEEPAAGDDDGDKDDKPKSRWAHGGKLADPWTLPQPDFFKNRNITYGGWLDGGVYTNQYGDPSNGPVGLRGIGDGFTMDQVWFFAERKTDTKGCGWDYGWRLDYLFGVDGPQTQSFGDRSWDYDWNTSSQYGFAMPQLYGVIAHNDLSVKIGHFYTPIGYEVVQAPQNFFYSHSYSHTYGEPFTHTGALGDYAYNDKTHIYGGWVNGWDEGFGDRNDGSMFLGGVSYQLSKKATLAWYVSAGSLGSGDAFVGAQSGNLYYNCFIFTYKINDKWTYVLEHDLGANSDLANGGANNQWYEINNYLIYKVSDCLSYGGRLEWFQDPQGARVVGGDAGSYVSLTAGLNWRPHSNVTIRPEVRYDVFNGTAGPDGLPFNNGASSSQLSGGFDAIFTF